VERQSGADVLGLRRSHPWVLLGAVPRHHIPDQAGHQPDARADPEGPAPAPVQQKIGDEGAAQFLRPRRPRRRSIRWPTRVPGRDPAATTRLAADKSRLRPFPERSASASRRTNAKEMLEGAMAVRPKSTPHQMVASARTRRGPKRSARRPVGAWNRAYPNVKALKTQPSWIALRWNSLMMALPETDMLTRFR